MSDQDEVDTAQQLTDDEMISDDEVTTTQTQIRTEYMTGVGSRPRRRKMKMVDQAEEADSDSGYSDAGLDQEPEGKINWDAYSVSE